MLAVIVAALTFPFAYSFPADKPVGFRLDARFEGFLPVLGGIDGSADIMLAVTVQGLQDAGDGKPRLEVDLSDAGVKLQEAKLPFDVDSVRQYFPKTTVVFDPRGRMVETDAPDVTLPIKLPGLDVKRFPEICFLPIEFPEGGIELGSEWSFDRTFDGVETPFTAKVISWTDQEFEVALKFGQEFSLLENEALEVVQTEVDAVSRVQCSVTGEGRAKFDRTRGLLKSIELKSKADSVVAPIKIGEKTTRTMTTTVKVVQG